MALSLWTLLGKIMAGPQPNPRSDRVLRCQDPFLVAGRDVGTEEETGSEEQDTARRAWGEPGALQAPPPPPRYGR